jgi:hypothetical protein
MHLLVVTLVQIESVQVQLLGQQQLVLVLQLQVQEVALQVLQQLVQGLQLRR